MEDDDRDLHIDEVPDEFTDLVAWAKQQKETAVNRPFDDPGDIEPRVVWWRDGQLVAQGFCDRVDRDRGLQMACIGIEGFGADQIDFAVDAHMTDQRFVQQFGRLPDPHELQNLCDNEGACQVGLTTDCIIVQRIWRDGHTVMISLPYHVDRRRQELEFTRGKAQGKKAMRDDPSIVREGDRFWRQTRWTHWIDDRVQLLDDRQDDKYKVGGIVADTLRHAFAHVDGINDKFAGLDYREFGLTAEIAGWHRDIAITRILMTAGFPIALASYSDEQAELIAHSVARFGIGALLDENGDEVPMPDVDLDDQSRRDNAAINLLALALREKLEREAKESHAEDLAEAERRRQARTGPGPSDEDRERLESEYAAWRGK